VLQSVAIPLILQQASCYLSVDLPQVNSWGICEEAAVGWPPAKRPHIPYAKNRSTDFNMDRR